jgi:O-antigen/teichoic acid export membrane protein
MKDASTTDNRDPNSALNRQAKIGIRRRLFLGFGSQTIAILLRIAQQFLIVPILIRGWGIELYADWIIIFSATSFLSMLDFGLSAYFSNALLIMWTRQDLAACRRLISTAFFVYGSIVLTAAIVLAVTLEVVPWAAYFETHVMSPLMALDTASILAISTLMLLPFGLIDTFYRAHGDYSRGIVINITAEALRGFGICAVVISGGQPITAALAYLIITILYGAGMIFDQWRHYGELQIGLAIPKTLELRQAITQSALYFSTTVTLPLYLNAPILLLGTLSEFSGAVVAYTVSRTFTGLMRQIVNQFCHPIGVEMARQVAIGNQAQLRRVFTAAGRMVAGSAGLLGGFTLVAAQPFLRIWTHDSVAFDPWLVSAFIATIILTAPAQVASTLYFYNNKPRILFIAQAGYGIGTLVFCLLLIKDFAAAGAAIGTGLAEFLSIGIILPYAASREVSVPLMFYFSRSYATALSAFVLSYGVAWGWNWILTTSSLVSLIELGVLWAVIIALPSFFLLLDPQERDWCVANVGKLFAHRKRMPRV